MRAPPYATRWRSWSVIELPRLVGLGRAPVKLLGYPLSMVLAQKTVTAMERGDANTRWRDFADVYSLIRTRPVDANELTTSLAAVSSFRSLRLVPLLPTLAEMPAFAQPKWQAWRVRVDRVDDLPADFAEVLKAIAAFIDPLVVGTAAGAMWNPHQARWE